MGIDFYTFGRWVGYLGVMGLVGAASFQVLVQAHLTAHHPEATRLLLGRTRRIALLAAAALLVGAVLKLAGQISAFAEPGEPVSRETITLIITGTTWGHGWLAQAGVALLALAVLSVSRSVWLQVPLAVAAVTVAPLTGHAVENPWGGRIGLLLHALHQLGGGIWIGTLALVVLVGYGASRVRPVEERDALIARLVHAYSPVAIAGVTIAALAGLLLGYGYVRTFSSLWSTPYGQILLVKTALLAATGAIGAYNWRSVRPRLGESAVTLRLQRSAMLELSLGTLLLGATAILVALPAPGME